MSAIAIPHSNSDITALVILVIALVAFFAIALVAFFVVKRQSGFGSMRFVDILGRQPERYGDVINKIKYMLNNMKSDNETESLKQTIKLKMLENQIKHTLDSSHANYDILMELLRCPKDKDTVVHYKNNDVVSPADDDVVSQVDDDEF